MGEENGGDQQIEQIAKGRVWEWRTAVEGIGEEFQGEPSIGA